jgi:hypothetical protein
VDIKSRASSGSRPGNNITPSRADLDLDMSRFKRRHMTWGSSSDAGRDALAGRTDFTAPAALKQ